MNKLIVITGQTATGKTSYALKLAHEKNGELINADSRQIYKHLDIITGKDLPNVSSFKEISVIPAKAGIYLNRSPIKSGMTNYTIGYHEIDSIRLWLYDVVDPKNPFSSFDYKLCAEKVIEDIISRGKTPIIVGGTYLYIKHLLYGVETENIPPDWKLREELNDKSVQELQDIICKLDVQMFKHLNNSDKNNPRRLIRKIEIASVIARSEATRQSLPVNRQVNEIATIPLVARDDTALEFIGLKYKNREDLEKNIQLRVMQRLELGAIEEVQSLLNKGYTRKDPGLATIGYKEILDFLDSKLTKEEMIKRWIISEVQYAKRQYTFMIKDNNINWQFL